MTNLDEYTRKLLACGFIPQEVRELLSDTSPTGSPVDVDAIFHSKPFKEMMASRFRWVLSLKRMGYTPKQVVGAIREYYDRKEKASPFDFLKIEYRPPKSLRDYSKGVQIRHADKVNRMSKQRFGISYGAKSWKAKNTTP